MLIFHAKARAASTADLKVWADRKMRGSKLRLTELLAASGRLSSATAPDLARVLAQTLDQGRSMVALDLEDVDYINSAGLRVLESSAQKLKAANGELILCGLASPVKLAFDVAGPLGVAFESSRDRAIERLR